MSGLFGIVNIQHPLDVKQFLDDVTRKMTHQAWHVSNFWVAPDISLGVGHHGIGIFNRAPQPVVQGDCLLWLCGELYQTQSLTRKLEIQNIPVSDSTDAALALSAYLEFGPDFATYLNGAFFIIIYDTARQKLILASDHYGLYPHYYHVTSQQLVFAPEVKGVLCAPGLVRKLDLTAASEYFRFQQILGEKTFHEGISLFPYGSVAQFDIHSGQCSVQRYWDWDHVPYRPQVTFEEAVEEAGQLLQQAVIRLSGGVRPGIFLSGGLDSRTLLGFIPPLSTPPVSAVFGCRDCRDVIYARQVARAVGSQHYWFNLPNGNWVTENVDLHLKLTEGFHSWIHMHGISILRDLRPVMDCNLTGWDGGTVMGHSDHINDIYNYPVDEWTVALRTYQQFTQAYTWPGLTDVEERLLFTPEVGKQMVGRAFESLLAEFSRFWKFRQEYAAEYFYIVNHCCRYTFHMVTTIRSALEVRFPFWDYELIDFIYSLPPHLRRDQLMYRTIITRRLPRLAHIPYDKQEYLPTVEPVRYNLHKTSVWMLKRLKLFPEHPKLYADYENYLRYELRDWAEGILFDPQTAQRGIFNMDFVRSLMNRHLAKHESWVLGKVAPLITFEMVMRDLFD
jgi:asparagine synthase (glutamine-hydrolysing)